MWQGWKPLNMPIWEAKMTLKTENFFSSQFCTSLPSKLSLVMKNAPKFSEKFGPSFCGWPQGSSGVQRYCTTGVSCGVRRTTWERSLWKLGAPNPFFSRVFLGREHFGTRPCQSPSRFGIRLHFFVRVARLKNEVGPKDFLWVATFLTKNAPKFTPDALSLVFVGPKKSSRKIPAKFPAKFLPNTPRTQRLKNIQSRLKFSISLENFYLDWNFQSWPSNLDWNFQSWPSEFPTTKKGFGGRLAWNLWAPGVSKKDSPTSFCRSARRTLHPLVHDAVAVGSSGVGLRQRTARKRKVHWAPERALRFDSFFGEGTLWDSSLPVFLTA